MAKTSGHGNGIWTRDETILALDLLLKCKGQVPNESDERVVELSGFLRALPIHPPEKKMPSFRNVDGVAFKLQNLRAVATGKGLQNVSVMDKIIWSELGENPDQVHKLAEQIRRYSAKFQRLDSSNDLEVVFQEGRMATAFHLKRERNRTLRNRLLAARKKAGALRCDACDLQAPNLPEIGDAMFEAHHLRPLSDTGPTNTKLGDLALVCANCHRMWHRAMGSGGEWLALTDFQTLISGEKPLQNVA